MSLNGTHVDLMTFLFDLSNVQVLYRWHLVGTIFSHEL